MAIAYGSSGAFAYGTTSVAPAYPSGITAGQVLILRIGAKPGATANIVTPSGWNLVGSATGTSGTNGNGTGPTKIAVFYKVATGSDSGTQSVSITSGTRSWGQISRYSNATGFWDISAIGGEDTSANTAFSVAMVTPDTTFLRTGDMCDVAFSKPTGSYTWSAEAIVSSGLTFSTITEIGESTSTTSPQIGGVTFYGSVLSGTMTTTTVTTSATASNGTNMYGPGVLLRMRETSAPIANIIGVNMGKTATYGTITVTPPSGAACWYATVFVNNETLPYSVPANWQFIYSSGDGLSFYKSNASPGSDWGVGAIDATYPGALIAITGYDTDLDFAEFANLSGTNSPAMTTTGPALVQRIMIGAKTADSAAVYPTAATLGRNYSNQSMSGWYLFLNIAHEPVGEGLSIGLAEWSDLSVSASGGQSFVLIPAQNSTIPQVTGVTTIAEHLGNNNPTITLPPGSVRYVIFLNFGTGVSTEAVLDVPSGWTTIYQGAPVGGEEGYFQQLIAISTSATPSTAFTRNNLTSEGWSYAGAVWGVDREISSYWFNKISGQENGTTFDGYNSPTVTTTSPALVFHSQGFQRDTSTSIDNESYPTALNSKTTAVSNSNSSASLVQRHRSGWVAQQDAGATTIQTWTAGAETNVWGYLLATLAISGVADEEEPPYPYVASVGTGVEAYLAASLDIPLPPGVVAGSLVVIAYTIVSSAAAPTATGYYLGPYYANTDTDVVRIGYMYHWASGPESGNITLYVSGAEAILGYAARVVFSEGTAPIGENPFVDTLRYSAAWGDSTTISSFTPNAGNSLLISHAWAYQSSNSFSNISGWNHTNTMIGTNNILFGWRGYADVESTGNLNFTSSGSGSIVVAVGTIRGIEIGAPLANAGGNQVNISAGATVTLNASASTDEDGTIVEYAWTQTGGSPTVSLSGSGPTRTFVAPPTLIGTTLTFQVTVIDNDSNTATDICTVAILPASIRIMTDGGIQPAFRNIKNN